jgi:hypothetical protein
MLVSTYQTVWCHKPKNCELTDRATDWPRGAEHYLRDHQLCSHSTVLQHFMEPKGSLPHSQELCTCHLPEPDQSSPQKTVIWSILSKVLPCLTRETDMGHWSQLVFRRYCNKILIVIPAVMTSASVVLWLGHNCILRNLIRSNIHQPPKHLMPWQCP